MNQDMAKRVLPLERSVLDFVLDEDSNEKAISLLTPYFKANLSQAEKSKVSTWIKWRYKYKLAYYYSFINLIRMYLNLD